MASPEPGYRPEISIVVPVYRGEDCLEELHRRLVENVSQVTPDFEMVLVEDRGPDESWSKIQTLAEKDPRIRGARLSRNFGQHHAITAGLSLARGNWVVVMDCDLQDRPEEIPRLYAEAQKGFDIVLARRTRRTDKWSKRFSSVMFYKVFNYLTDLNYDGTVANFSIVSRKVVDQMRQMPEAVRFYGGFLTWMGFDRSYIDVTHGERYAGESSYTFTKLMQLATPVILAYSNKPLRLCIYAGTALAGLSVLGAGFVTVRALFYEIPVMGWPSLFVMLTFSTGAIIAVLGVLGLYIDRIFTEVKRRPLFIVGHKTFND